MRRRGMQILVHRGANQIGGCITEIRSKNARIIIDVGAELPGSESSSSASVNVNEITKGCDGVLITHYHGDHIGEYKYIADGVNTYMGEQAKEVFLILQEKLSEFSEISNATKEDVEKVRNFIPLKQGESFDIKDMTITPIRTDHSAFDSYMYLIEADGERILHTGDYRTHGAVGKGTPKALKAIVAKDKLDALIIEGTMLARPDENVISEFKLQKDAAELIAKKKYVFIHCGSTNIDRIASFYHANKSVGKRLFVHDGFQDEILKYVTKSSSHHTTYYDFSDAKNYSKELYNQMKRDGFCLLLRETMLASRSGLYKLTTSKNFKDSTFIFSQWKGYLEGKNRNEELIKAMPKEYRYLHTSGHATKSTLIDTCNLLKPGVIIPIHKEKSSSFNKLKLPYRVVPLSDNQVYDVASGCLIF